MSGVRDYVDGAFELFAERGVGAIPQLSRLVIGKLRYGIGVEQFLLFDLPQRPLATWPDYVTTRDFAPFFRFINNARGRDFFNDKIRTAERCAETGIPFLPITAVVGRRYNDSHCFRMISDRAALAAFLDSPDMPGNAFLKPAGAYGGAGAFQAHRTPGGWQIDRVEVSSEAFADRLLTSPDDKGMLVQRQFRAPEELKFAGAGQGLPTLRVQTMLTHDGPELLYIIQKIVVGQSVDNFSSGAKGNLIAAVDGVTGRLGRAYGRPNGRRLLIGSFATHPGNGERIADREVTAFDEIKKLALDTARAFPEMPLLALDIAVTEEGAMIVETNSSPDQLLAQIACRRGGAEIYRDVVPRLAVDEEIRRHAAALFKAILEGNAPSIRDYD